MSDSNIIDSCANCTWGWKNFQKLTKKELQYVNENRYEAAFKPGEILIKQGTPTSSALFLSKGLAKIYIEGINGKNFIMSIAKPGRIIIGPGAYVDSRHTYSVSAITTIHACFISFDVFRHLVRTNGTFAESMIEDISLKSLRTHSRMVNLTQKKMPGRLAETLLYFADEIFNTNEYNMILSRQELGEMTNMAKESVVRILKEFEARGIINSSSSKITILDKEKLKIISERG
jgi:CRP/FNR family transcriptional regulator, polysaccharide utilization system transcription regulator